MKPYDIPRVGDTVWHVDEPSQGFDGTVTTVGDDGYFKVRWYDGEVDEWSIADHPDIVLLELS